MKVANVEFACNRAHSLITSHSPFEVVYGLNPFMSIDLVPLVKCDIVGKKCNQDGGSILKNLWSMEEKNRRDE